ncbi:MAG: tyrosine-type recombinase/integrase [Gemmatimonadales bacterium]
MAEKLTDKLVKSLPAPASGNKITYDTNVHGFGFRVTAAGARAFILNYRINGRERRYTIGAYPDWSVGAAREEAKRLKRQVDRGYDPMGQRHAERAAPTVAELARRFLEEHAMRKVLRAQADDRAMIEKLVLPVIGQLKVHDVRGDDIDRLHRDISRTRPIRANRVAQLLSKMFSLAVRWEYRSDNPVKGIHRNPEPKRTRYLSNDELKRLIAALASRPNQTSANVIRMLLLTGARRGEVLNARWDQFDLEAGVWTKPSAHTKQKKEHRVPLSALVMQLLSQMRNSAGSSPYVFPGRVPGKPLKEIKGFWAGVCKEAKIEDCRIHDLRHTYASILASAGHSLPVIGALLGHTQPNTTARYSHLFDDPLREATEQVGSVVTDLSAAGT